MFGLYRWLRRRGLARRPVPGDWIPHLERRVPFFEELGEEQRERFLGHLKVFAWEKDFIGAGGFEIDDEVRVVVSAAAVRLVLHLDVSYYDRLTEIVVYPEAFRRPGEDTWVLGEAHSWGTVVLAWKSVLLGLANQEDGRDTAARDGT